jgi:transcriptional regulator with XRE-family HTH domain
MQPGRVRPLPPPAAFARNLRDAREKAGFSQEALAERAGMHRNAVALLETGKRDPRVSTVAKLAEALSIPASNLLKDI